MLLKHAGLFFLADDEHRAVGLEKRPGGGGGREGCVRAKGGLEVGRNSMEVQTSIYNEAKCIAMFYKIFHRNVEERIMLKK